MAGSTLTLVLLPVYALSLQLLLTVFQGYIGWTQFLYCRLSWVLK